MYDLGSLNSEVISYLCLQVALLPKMLSGPCGLHRSVAKPPKTLKVQCWRWMTLRGATETNVFPDCFILRLFFCLFETLNVPEMITFIPLF